MTTPSKRPTRNRTGTSNSSKIIAIGGAKGGIGKSVFCANLGVFLSSLKNRVVLVDLDLGGANLHLFLGLWSLKRRLQDYLEKKYHTIEDVLVATPHGPYLAGGGGAKLGSAHLPFVRKLKLLRALSSIDADYIILDLGGDTTFNSLDYFLAADARIVLTTCDPASYLDAYNFIKLALHRKLTRIFGPENHVSRQRDPALLACINEFVNAGLSGAMQKTETLLTDVRQHHPAYLEMIEEILRQSESSLVINMASDTPDTVQLAQRLINVSNRMLSLNLNYLGSIAMTDDIKQCTLDLIPHVIRYPQGILSKFFQKICPVI